MSLADINGPEKEHLSAKKLSAVSVLDTVRSIDGNFAQSMTFGNWQPSLEKLEMLRKRD